MIRDSPLLDALLLIPIGQKLVSLEARQEMRDLEQGETSLMAQMFFQSESTKPDTKVDTQSRLKILESFLRPVLVPTNQWKDVKRWQFQNRFIKWAREEILHAKFSPDLRASMAAYPDIPNSLQMQASRGSVFRHASGSDYDSQHAGRKRPKAPKTSNLQQALSMQDWSERKDTAAVSKPMTTLVQKLDGEIVKLGGGGFRLAYASDSADISEMQIEDILELAGGHVVNCGPFNALCEEVNMYQFWTEEYIEGLGRYLGKRASRFNGETIVLDVGAGDGVLAVHLKDYFTRSRSARPSRQKLKTRSAVPDPIKPTQAVTEPPRIIATDDGSWSIGTKAPVEALGVEEALSKYCDESKLLQVIVLCSWMPMSEDWTSLFRMSKVDEYILIGECDDGTVRRVVLCFLIIANY